MCLERSGRLWTLDGLFTPDDEVLQSMDLGVDVSSPPHSSARGVEHVWRLERETSTVRYGQRSGDSQASFL